MQASSSQRSHGWRFRAWLAAAAGYGWLLLLSTAEAASAADGCAPSLLILGRARPGDLIALEPKARVPRRLFARAIAVWKRCPDYGLDFPAFVVDADQRFVRAARTLTVEYHPRSHSATCGRFRGNEIHVYGFARGPEGRVRHCGSPALVLAHELGHVLGLADASKEPACRAQVMAYVDELNRYERRVHDTECRAAGRRWVTASERPLTATPGE